MKKLTTILSAVLIMVSFGLSAQDLNDAGEAYNEAISLTKENKTYEAIESYQECVEICSQLGEVGEGLQIKAETQISSLFMKLGIDAYKEKEYDTAVSLFEMSSTYAQKVGNKESAGKANNFIATSYAAKGNGHYKSKQYDQAIEMFNKAIMVNPEYFKAYYGLVISYNKTGNTEGLEEAITNVIKYGGEDQTVEKAKGVAATYFLNTSGQAIQEGNFNVAAMMAKKSIEYNYLEPTAYYYLALSKNNLQDYNSAIEAANTGLKEAEGESKSNLQFELGRAYEGIGDNTKACEAYGKVTSGPNLDAATYQKNTVLNCQ